MFDVIERLKSEWTDKYVVINSSAPELARFAHATGTVKTVNMNGRCLVEFDQFNNIGWYDIDPAALKIVSEPLPKPAPKEKPKEASKPAATAKPAAGSKPAGAKPAPKAGGAGKPSTADILAAARAKAGGAPAAATSAKKASPAENQGEKTGEKKPAPAGKLSTAEILAKARAAKTAAAETPAPPAEEEEPLEPAAAESAPVTPASAKKAPSGGPQPTTTAEKIAWCRQHDSKS